MRCVKKRQENVNTSEKLSSFLFVDSFMFDMLTFTVFKVFLWKTGVGGNLKFPSVLKSLDFELLFDF